MTCKLTERGWAGYILDIMTMGGYTTYRVHQYSECIRLNYPVAPTGSYRRYTQEVNQLLNKNEVDDRTANTGQSKDTTM
jgi:hypothetical protein